MTMSSEHVPTVQTESELSSNNAIVSYEDALRQFKPTTAFYLAMTTLAILTFTVALDGTALGTALPIVAEQIHGTGLQAFWAGTGFMLCCAVFQPVIGSVSGVFGRKLVLTISVLFFLAGCLGCALAKNFDMLLIFRSIQGAGGGGIVVMTEIIVCDMIPLRLRGEWFGILSSMYAVGTVLGPLLGGLLSQHVSWRWVFYINLPFISVALVMVPLCINLNVLPSSFVEKLKRIDFIGSLSFIGSATSFMMGISWGGVQYPWSSWHTVVPITLGFLGFIGFFLYEEYVALEPIVPTRIFKTRNAIAGYLNTILHNMIVLSFVYFLPLYYQGVKGFSTTITGVAVFPETFTVAPVAVAVGILISKFGVFRWAVWFGWIITTFGMGILFLLDVNTSTVKWIFLNIAPGIGTGALYPAMQFSIQAACEDEDLAAAVSMYSFFRSLGQTLGIAIGGVVLQNQLVIKLQKYPNLATHAADYGRDASGLARLLSNMPSSQDKTDLVQAYADSLKVVWMVMCGLAGLGLLTSLLIKDYPLDRFAVPKKVLDSSEEANLDTEKDLGAVLEKK